MTDTTEHDEDQAVAPLLGKAALLAERAGQTEDVPLPALGGSVRVRGLTRREALRVQGKQMDAAASERLLLSLAMVEPRLTEDEVGQWQRQAPAGELEPLSAAILRMSGMTATAVKDEMATFRE